jgi:hypothetical protein
MDSEQQQPQSEERRGESTLLKLHEEFHQFMQECRDCRREIEGHWQFCAHCGIRLATHCPGCATRCPRSVRMPAPGVAWPYHPSSPETWTRLPGCPKPGSLQARSGVAGRQMLGITPLLLIAQALFAGDRVPPVID